MNQLKQSNQVLQLRINEETEESFEIMKGFLDTLHEKGERAELKFVADWEKGDMRLLAIVFFAGILFGLMGAYLLGFY